MSVWVPLAVAYALWSVMWCGYATARWLDDGDAEVWWIALALGVTGLWPLAVLFELDYRLHRSRP